jgi:hypothetical protein
MSKPDNIEQQHWDAAKAVTEAIVIMGGFRHGKSERASILIARAIHCAANAAAPKVKPLAWYPEPQRFAGDPGRGAIVAGSIAGDYEIESQGYRGHSYVKFLGVPFPETFNNLQAAKDATQAHYHQRIFSALEGMAR